MVAAVSAFGGRRRIGGGGLQPVSDHVVVELLRPQHAGKGLTHYTLRIRRQFLRNDRGVELVSFTPPSRKCFIEAAESLTLLDVRVSQTQASDMLFSRSNR